jgi:hypothetical protein
MNRTLRSDSYKIRAKTDFTMRPVFVAALEVRMEMLVALELIVGAVFVVGFWYKNPELVLSRHSNQRLLDPYDDEDNDDARVRSSIFRNGVRVDSVSQL